MEKRTGRKLRGLLLATILSMLVGAAAHSAPVRANGGGAGGPPPPSIVVAFPN
jgi:hypothetical protein